MKTQEEAKTESNHAQSNDCATQMDSWNKPQTVFAFSCCLDLLFHDPMDSHQYEVMEERNGDALVG